MDQWIRNCCCAVVVVVVVGTTVFKKAQDVRRFKSNRGEIGRNVPQVNTHRLIDTVPILDLIQHFQNVCV